MPLPSIPHVYRVGITYRVADAWEATNVLDFVCTASSDPTAIGNSAGQAFADASAFAAAQNDNVEYQGAYVTPFDGLSGGTAVNTDAWLNTQGTQSANSLPASVCAIFTKNTGLGGRSRRGRIYLGGLPDNWLAGNQTAIDVGHQDDLQAAGAAFFLACADQDPIVTPVLVSSIPEPAYFPLTSLTARSYLTTQRRRLERLE